MKFWKVLPSSIQSNIRELEGALNRILAFADLSGSALTPNLVEVALADLLPQRSDVEPEKIIELVAEGMADYRGSLARP